MWFNGSACNRRAVSALAGQRPEGCSSQKTWIVPFIKYQILVELSIISTIDIALTYHEPRADQMLKVSKLNIPRTLTADCWATSEKARGRRQAHLETTAVQVLTAPAG
jgi:hypothetical protein